MKTITMFRRFSGGVWICAVLSSAMVASAQTTPGDAPRRPQPPGEGSGQRPERAFGGQRPQGAGDAAMTEDQRQLVREAFEPDREQNVELYKKMMKARKELQDAEFAEKSDPEAIRAKAAEVGKVEAELAVLRSKAFARLRSKLPPEQMERLKNNPVFGGGFGAAMMGQGGQRPGAGDYRRPGTGDDAAPRRPQPPGAGQYGQRGGDQADKPRRPAAPPADDKP